jgi:hypothetical protein
MHEQADRMVIVFREADVEVSRGKPMPQAVSGARIPVGLPLKVINHTRWMIADGERDGVWGRGVRVCPDQVPLV